MIGKTEFHAILDKVKQSQLFSSAQLLQLCKETQLELNSYPRSKLQTMVTFDRYYTMDWGDLELLRLAKFIKTGAYKKEFELYG